MNPDLADSTATPPTFDVMPLSKELRQAIDELGYTHPTPVQREVFEPACRGRDIVVQARTGTGKTAAFGMPVVDALVQRNLAAVQVVILCPTRELALQVHREIDTLGRYRGIKSVAVYGGAPMVRQIEELSAGAQVLAGTPGRVLDHLRRGSLDPSAVRVFILDESDEMLSMGFLPQINEILGYLPAGHQSLLFSATLPPDIQRHAETRLKDPLFLTLSGDQIGALDIQHLVYLTQGDKLKDFVQVLEVENPESAIVFCNTRDETKRVAATLERLGYAADWLNADLAQNEREKVMAATRRGDLRFLVCTDVAARGIDISHLTHVINFDLPESAESYVHRTGRTGRAGRTGTAISLIEPSDIGNLYMLRLTYKIFPIERQLPTAGELRTRQELDVVQMFDEAFCHRHVHPDDLSLARRLMTHDAAEQIIACLLRDHLGARPDAVREATEARRARGPAAPVASIETRPETAPRNGAASGRDADARSAAPSPRNAAPRNGAASGRDADARGAAPNPRNASPRVATASSRDADARGADARGAAQSPRDVDARGAAPSPRDADPRSGAAPSEPLPPGTNADADADASTSRRGAQSSGEIRAPEPRRDTTTGSEIRAPESRRDTTTSGEIRAPEPRRDTTTGSPTRNGGTEGAPRGHAPRLGRQADPRGRRRSSDPADSGTERVYRDDDFEFGYVVSEPAQGQIEPVQKAEVPSGIVGGEVSTSSDMANTTEIFVNVGRIDGATVAEFQEILEQAGIRDAATSNINLRRNHCFVRVPTQDFPLAEAALNGRTIAGKVAFAERSRSSRA